MGISKASVIYIYIDNNNNKSYIKMKEKIPLMS